MKIDVNFTGSHADINITVGPSASAVKVERIREIIFTHMNSKFYGRRLDDALRHEVQRFVQDYVPLLFLLASLGIKI